MCGVDCRSFIIQIEHKPFPVDYLAVVRDRHEDEGATFGVDQFDGLRHCVGIFPAMLHGLEAQARPVQVRGLADAFPAPSLQIYG